MKTSKQSPNLIQRRKVIKAMAGLPFLGCLAFAAEGNPVPGSPEEKHLLAAGVSGAGLKPLDGSGLDQLKGKIPHAKIKGVEVSRVIMGGNLLGGWAHARDLLYVSDLVKTYHTDEKTFQTLQLAEECGINSLITNPMLLPSLQKYWSLGGKIQFISDGGFNYREDIQKSVDAGAAACYLHGGVADMLAKADKLDEFAWAVDKIRQSGIPAGIGAHELETVKKCVEYGISPDFWMKTLHKNNYWSARIDQERKNTLDKDFADNIFCQNPDETIAFMNKLEQPWIAYKIMAAGAIKPNDAFQWAFEQGADYICVGMFDFQMIDNVNLAYEILKKDIPRKRPWRA